jgi:hypothetical protein
MLHDNNMFKSLLVVLMQYHYNVEDRGILYYVSSTCSRMRYVFFVPLLIIPWELATTLYISKRLLVLSSRKMFRAAIFFPSFFALLLLPTTTTACNSDCTNKVDKASCCYNGKNGYCHQQQCINRLKAQCIFQLPYKCVYGDCDTIGSNKFCLHPKWGQCVNKNKGAFCRYDGSSAQTSPKEGVCGNVTTTDTDESSALGCSGGVCHGCVEGREGACWGKNEGDECRPYRTYDDCSGSCCGCWSGWTAYTGGKCFHRYGKFVCENANGVFTKDAIKKTKAKGIPTHTLVVVGAVIFSCFSTVMGIRWTLEVKKFLKKLNELLQSHDDKCVVEGKITKKETRLETTQSTDSNGRTTTSSHRIYEVVYEFYFPNVDGREIGIRNNKRILQNTYQQLPDASAESKVNVIYSKTEPEFHFLEIDAKVESENRSPYKYLMYSLLLGPGSMIGITVYTIVSIEDQKAFIENVAENYTTSLIISWVIYMLICGTCSALMWKEKIFTGKTITRGFYGKHSKILGGSTSVGQEQTSTRSYQVKPAESI